MPFGESFLDGVGKLEGNDMKEHLFDLGWVLGLLFPASMGSDVQEDRGWIDLS